MLPISHRLNSLAELHVQETASSVPGRPGRHANTYKSFVSIMMDMMIIIIFYSVVEKEEEKGPSSGIQFSTELVRHYKNWNLVPVRLVADVFHTIGKSLNGVRVSHWADPIVEKVSGLESPLVYETITTSSIPS